MPGFTKDVVNDVTISTKGVTQCWKRAQMQPYLKRLVSDAPDHPYVQAVDNSLGPLGRVVISKSLS